MAPTDSPVTPEPKPAVVWADRPIMVEVVCPNCATGTVLGGPCAFCQGFALVLTLSPSSLAARYIELGRAGAKMLAKRAAWEELGGPGSCPQQDEYGIAMEAMESAFTAVRTHPDFRPDQKEGTHDA